MFSLPFVTYYELTNLQFPYVNINALKSVVPKPLLTFLLINSRPFYRTPTKKNRRKEGRVNFRVLPFSPVLRDHFRPTNLC